MTINTTTWTPDTCDNPPCIIQYTWDDSVPQDSRVHSFTVFLQKCPIHAAMTSDDNTKYNTNVEENSRKNQAYQHIIDNSPSSVFDLDSKTNAKLLKKGLALNFSFTGTPPNRVVTLTLTGTTLTQQQKNIAQAALDNRFGTGKVLFVN